MSEGKVAGSSHVTAMPASLPPLAFGNASAQASDDLSSFLMAQRAAMTGIRRYEPLPSKHGFRHRAAQVRVGDVRIVSSASTPLSVEVQGSAETTLLVPFHGWGTSLVDGREHRWQAGSSAMFLPGSPRNGVSGVRSVVAITLQVAFRKSFNCSPREWIRQRRLLLARERLRSSTHTAMVSTVATPKGGTAAVRHVLF